MIVVACSLPAGLLIEYAGTEVRLNGAHIGIDMEDMPRNGMMADTADRQNGFGLTKLEGDGEAAFTAWVDEVTKGPDGKPLQHPFAPIASGAIKWAKSEVDVRKETQDGAIAVPGLDPSKDLPPEVTEDKDAKKGK